MSTGSVMATNGADTSAEILRGVLAGDSREQALKGLVSLLRRDDYAVIDLMREANEVKRKLAGALASDEVLDGWKAIDEVTDRCLARTSYLHEAVIEGMAHAFLEFAPDGAVTYANAAMRSLGPDCLGRSVFELFDDAEGVRRMMAAPAGEAASMRLGLLASGDSRPVIAQFGFVDCDGGRVHYTTLVDMSAFVEAERAAHERAPYAVLKLDPQFRILYANQKATALIGKPLSDLVGRDAREMAASVSRPEVMAQSERRRTTGHGDQYTILLDRPDGDAPATIRVTSHPELNPDQSCAGYFVTLEDISVDVAAEELLKAVATITDSKQLFLRMLEIVRPFVDFDQATLDVYTADRDAVRTALIEPQQNYASRWLPIPEELRDWALGPTPWLDDMAEFLSKTPGGQQVMTNTTVAEVLDHGLKACVCVPLRENGKLVATISLVSKTRGLYGRKHHQLLKKLGVSQAASAILNATRQEEDNFVLQVIKDLSAYTADENLDNISLAGGQTHIADVLVKELVRFGRYPNVTVLKVNALAGRFELLSQASGAERPIIIDDNFQQDISKGMLSLAYERDEIRVLKRRGDDSEDDKKFEDADLNRNTRSSLCMPIHLNGRILWMLAIDSEKENDFGPPEVELLKRLISQLESTLSKLFQSLFLHEIVEALPDAVIVADIDGRILSCNLEACRLLQRERRKIGGRLSEYDADLQRMATARSRSSAPLRKTFSDRQGRQTAVLASAYLLPEQYDQTVIVMKNVSKIGLDTEFQSLDAAISEAAAICRVPLSVASSLIRKIEGAEEDWIAQSAGKAIRQLRKAELTYDRVVSSFAADAPAAEDLAIVSLVRIVDHAVAELPDLDREAISVEFDEADASGLFVRGQLNRLVFAVESVVAYLLRNRSLDDRMVIHLSAGDGHAEIKLHGRRCVTVVPVGDVETVVENTRARVTLGAALLSRIATEHRGTFEQFVDEEDGETFVFRLPSVNLRSAA